MPDWETMCRICLAHRGASPGGKVCRVQCIILDTGTVKLYALAPAQDGSNAMVALLVSDINLPLSEHPVTW